MEQKTYLTPEQLAARWGVSEGTLANWRSQKKIRFFKSLGRVYYKLTDVITYERKNSVIARPQEK
jgi:hypothetical protein